MTSYEAGRIARRQGCHRILCNWESERELWEWQRGWDAEDATMPRAEANIAKSAILPRKTKLLRLV